jgi:hypothetical protein
MLALFQLVVTVVFVTLVVMATVAHPVIVVLGLLVGGAAVLWLMEKTSTRSTPEEVERGRRTRLRRAAKRAAEKAAARCQSFRW